MREREKEREREREREKERERVIRRPNLNFVIIDQTVPYV